MLLRVRKKPAILELTTYSPTYGPSPICLPTECVKFVKLLVPRMDSSALGLLLTLHGAQSRLRVGGWREPPVFMCKLSLPGKKVELLRVARAVFRLLPTNILHEGWSLNFPQAEPEALRCHLGLPCYECGLFCEKVSPVPSLCSSRRNFNSIPGPVCVRSISYCR